MSDDSLNSELNARITAAAMQLKVGQAATKRKAAKELYELCSAHRTDAARAIPALLPCLGDADPQVREKAEWALAYCGPAALPGLIQSLADESPVVRRHAADAMSHMGDKGSDDAAAAALRQLLKDPVAAVRKSAARTLSLMGDDDEATLTRLGEMILSTTATDRAAALHAFGNISPGIENKNRLAPYVPLIIAAAGDSDEDARRWAYYALTDIGLSETEQLKLYIHGLDDPHEEVCEMAAGRLKRLAATADLNEAVPGLCRLVARGKTGSRTACEVLQLAGPAAAHAVPTLVAALESDDPFLVANAAEAIWVISGNADGFLPALRRLLIAPEVGAATACNVVSSIGPAAAPLATELVQLLKVPDWDLQWATAEALGATRSGDPKVVRALVEALDHESGLVCSTAARALGQIGAPAVPKLRRLLTDGDSDHQMSALAALGQMAPGTPETSAVLPILRQLLHHPEQDRRAWAAIALGKIARSADAVPVLIEVLREIDRPFAAKLAAEALAAIGRRANAALGALRELVGNDDEEVRNAVASAIEAIERG